MCCSPIGEKKQFFFKFLHEENLINSKILQNSIYKVKVEIKPEKYNVLTIKMVLNLVSAFDT